MTTLFSRLAGSRQRSMALNSQLPVTELTKAVLRTALVLLAVVVVLPGCGGDDVGVNGKHKADASGNLADGAISGLDGAISADGHAGADGTSDGGSGDTGGAGDTSGSADTSGAADSGATTKTPCSNNTICKADEFCALYYNGVAKLEGDGTPAVLPGWANVCEPDGADKAQEGEACDPIAGDSDTSLKACVNASTCMQGTCTALCEKDDQCPTGTRCGASEYGKVLPKQGGGDGTAWLPIDVCIPLPGDAGSCAKDADCKAGATCRPWMKRTSDGFTSEGRCVTAETGKKKVGEACGIKSSATGLGKLCDSTLCLYEYGGKETGVCTSTCSTKADCPATLTWGGVAFPTACAGLLTNHSGTEAAEDDVYIPHCVAVNEKSSLADCTTKRACDGSQACKAFAIANGPDTAAKVEYLCVELTTKTQPKGPTLADGAACDLFAADMACKGGYCLAGTDGKGFCSRLCLAGDDCGGGLKCDTSYPLIPRKDSKKAATTGICLK
ncbi:MAG: hypothetical protein KC502_12525 [Myxococcales bacterium]|nr:hypothetical protein [Myxococcales bacterium]